MDDTPRGHATSGTTEPIDSRVSTFWTAFLDAQSGTVPTERMYYDADCFGNTDEMANDLADRVTAGIKTTTSGLLWGYEAETLTPPVAGDLSIVLDASAEPRCVIETVEVHIMPFNAVDEQFAFEYGEGDRTLAWWREHLWDYYVVECAGRGWQPSPEMPLVCHRFRVVYPRTT